MLKITTENSSNHTTIKLEGKLAGAWVAEVEQVWRSMTSGGPAGTMLVDLCGVTFISADGKTLLRQLSRGGAEFRCCGPDIRAAVEEAEREALSEPAARS